ncbi:hypothetical protein GCM10023100_43110 [Actinocorallia cavernae]|uniref:Uncharacterized protein n=2 Tax=Actinomycetes TaxID=1760 RepID=A0ABP8ST53_9ACTN
MRLQHVDMVQDRGEVGQRVVVPLGFLPAGEQIVRIGHGIRTALATTGGIQGTDETETERVEVGHGGILLRAGAADGMPTVRTLRCR